MSDSGSSSNVNFMLKLAGKLAVSLATITLGSIVAMKVLAAYKQHDHDEVVGRETLEKLGVSVEELTTMEIKVAQQLIAPDDVDVSFKDIGGLEEVKRGIREAIILPIQRPDLFKHIRMPKGVLLYGPPGTGKTMLAKAVAKESGASFLSVSISVVQSKWFGESQKLITAVFSLARKMSPCLIFIDEIDCLIGNARSMSNTHNDQLLSCLLTQWDGLNDATDDCRVSVLAASNSPTKISTALHRRMAQQFKVGLPGKVERIDILEKTLGGMSLPIPSFLPEIAEFTAGYSGSDLSELCKAACLLPIREHILMEEKTVSSENTVSVRPLKLTDFTEAKKVVRQASAHLL